MPKIVTIVGARPQFVKAAVVSRAIKKYGQGGGSKHLREVIVHTGQHYDANMSEVFFTEMQLPKPDHCLDIHGLSHGAMTGRMLERIEALLLEERPDMVLVYGDTNTTLAGALGATKLCIQTAHVEAGLRSFNRMMPEETNRVLTDHVSDILFCPTENAMENLRAEGIGAQDKRPRDKPPGGPGPGKVKARPIVALVGDVMLDAALFYKKLERKPPFEVPHAFILATVHRAENTDHLERLKSVFRSLVKIGREIPIILPLHPRTRKAIEANGISIPQDYVRLVEPVGYLSMVFMLKRCKMVITDSGGMQKEAFFFKKPCLTLRDETEWVELVEHGYNCVKGVNGTAVWESYREMEEKKLDFHKDLYGDGRAGEKIVEIIAKNL